MNRIGITEKLANLPIGELRYYPQVGSTNDLAVEWASQGAPDLSLVVADEQTSGRGRGGRKWYTPPGAALAFSLILRPRQGETAAIFPRLSALGALSVCKSLIRCYGLEAGIKWPNDVVINRKKVAGMLAESHWMGDQLVALILGIGVNVKPESIPSGEKLDFPATCVETALGQKVNRGVFLYHILKAFLDWRPTLHNNEFIQSWEEHLAFRGEKVQILSEKSDTIEGEISGLTPLGNLTLITHKGTSRTFQNGEVHLRLVDREGI